LIEGGATRTNSLFHSFLQFNIDEGQRVDFANPPNIENIFSRVTGDNLSEIFGTLGVLGNADLYLINPRGFTFGPNATLDIPGSFTATTASSIAFSDGNRFSATEPATAPLLTVNVEAPVGVMFTGDIVNEGNLEAGKNLTLEAVNLDIQGRIITGEGQKGNITLTANGNIDVTNAFLNSGSTGFVSTGGDITLTANGNIDTTDTIFSTGSIGLRSIGGDITLEANGNIETIGTIFNSNNISLSGVGGNIQLLSLNGGIEVEESLINSGPIPNSTIDEIDALSSLGIDIDDDFLQLLRSAGNGNGNGGDISLSARENIKVGDFSLINSSGGRSGAAGFIDVDSQADIALSRSVVRGETRDGVGGDFTFDAESVSFITSAIINQSRENAQAGNIRITANQALELDQFGYLLTENRGIQPTGKISIETDRLTVQGGSVISTSTDSNSPTGTGGELSIDANVVQVSGTGPQDLFPRGDLFPSALISLSLGASEAGTLRINTDQLIIEDGGIISAATLAEGGGKGGDIIINSDDFVRVTGTSENQLFGSSISVDTANSTIAGNLILTTDQLSVQNGAGISASTFSQGQGGNLTVNASDILLQGTSQDGQVSSGIYAQSFAEGNGGNINIYADGELSLQNGARIVVSNDFQAEDAGNLLEKTRNLITALREVPELDDVPPTVIERRLGTGDAGKIEISANNISLHNQAAILGETASGEGGNISLDIWDLLLLRLNSEISTTAGTAQSGGNGGNIIIDAPNGFVFGVSTENSDIAANAFTGDGGSVNINAQAIFGLEFRPERTPLSDITASSEFGFDGIVNLSTLDVD
ncbi:filamentous hemagglutinin N-terminal domain-containing protein, partial [Leptolyngbya cf. ectocarpi LEGE 11479]